MPPSPLDGPFYFDDEPMSAWYLQDESFAAPRSEVEAKALRYSALQDPPTVQPEHQEDPIGIELVRGANGPTDDNWTILVDGVRCRAKPEVLQDGSTVFRCQLPPCVPPSQEGGAPRLTTATRARPVVVGVRLEDEAVAPARVRLHVDQVLRSSERQAQSKNKPEVTTTESADLKPYRTSDLQSSVVQLQYPFVAPAQSVLGVLSLSNFLDYESELFWVESVNTVIPLINVMLAQDNKEQQNKQTAYKRDGALRAATNTADIMIGKAVDYVVGGDTANSAASDAALLQRARRAKPLIKFDYLDPPSAAQSKESKTMRIGGGKLSSARELGILFERLTMSCISVEDADVEQLITSATDQETRLKAKLFGMKAELQANGESKALFLLRALCDSEGSPGIKEFLLSAGAKDASIDKILLTVRYDPSSRTFKTVNQTGDGVGTSTSSSSGQDAVQSAKGIAYLLEAFKPVSTERYKSRKAELEEQIENSESDEERKRLGEALKSLKTEYEKEQDQLSKEIEKRKAESAVKLDEELSAPSGKSTADSSGVAVTGNTAQLQYPYLFTYDRLMLNKRLATTVGTKFRVEVFDRNTENVSLFEFEPSMQDGVVAHAIYSRVLDDIEYMNSQAVKFVDCLFGPYIDSGDSGDSGRKAVNKLESIRASLNLNDYEKKKLRFRSKLLTAFFVNKTHDLIKNNFEKRKINVFEIELRIAELRLYMQNLLPTPALEEGGVKTRSLGASEADVDGDLLEPGVGAASAREDVSNRVVFAASRAEYESNLSDSDSCEDGRGTTTEAIGALGSDRALRLARKKENERIAFEEKRAELALRVAEDVANYSEKLIKEAADALEKADAADEYSIVYSGEERGALLIRRLPQILIPRNLEFAFEIPDSVQPPLRFLTFEASTSLLWRQVAGIAGRTALVVGAALLISKIQSQIISGSLAASSGLLSIILNNINPNASTSAYNIASGLWQYLKGTTAGLINAAEAEFRNSENLRNNLWYASQVAYNNWRSRILSNEELLESYRKHADKERGVPVKEAFACARLAVTRWKESERDRIKSLGDFKAVATVHNPGSGARFRFTEYFDATDTSKIFKGVLYNNAAWEAAPNTSALEALPPADADVAYSEAEELRAVPLSKTTAFVAGSAASGVMSSWMGTAAVVAFHELARAIVTFLRRSHGGSRLERSVGDLAMEITQRAGYILKRVYGEAAGVTLVQGNDTLWTCLRASAFARLALQHVSVFNEAPTFPEGADGFSGVKEALQFWQLHRRVVVDAFVDALEAEAGRYRAMASTQQYSWVALDSPAQEHVATIQRIAALSLAVSKDEVEVVKDLVRMSLSGIESSVEEEDDNVDTRAEKLVESSWSDIRHLSKDQATMEPRFATWGRLQDSASWASRRVDTSFSRSLRIGRGVGSLVEYLSSLSLSDNGDKRPLVFYCPVGSRLAALPGARSFDVEGVNNRVVWLHLLVEAAKQVLHSLHPQKENDGENAVRGEVELQAVDLRDNRSFSGMQRNPSCVTARGNKVTVGLAAPYPSKQGAPSASGRIALVRRRAFNADRLFFALSLAYSKIASSGTPEESSLRVALPAARDDEVLCLAIALAIRRVEGGGGDFAMKVVVGSPERSASLLEALVKQMELASVEGCRVCRLIEVALCVPDASKL